MLDTLSITQESSVADYQRDARALIDSLLDQGTPVVVVGGTGLYIKALIDELNFPDRDPQIRERLFAESEEFGATAMHKRLAVLDADAAALIPEQNVRRVIRALEVIELTGEPYAASLPRDEKSYYPHAHQFAIRVEREVLNQRISERVAQMWREGFVSEVEALLLQGLREGRTARAAIGYAQVLAALEGQLSAELAMEETVTSTRQYARRQGTWFAREPRITWLTGPRERLLERILESSGNS
jgi:tRNA dimethylallyltransferase